MSPLAILTAATRRAWDEYMSVLLLSAGWLLAQVLVIPGPPATAALFAMARATYDGTFWSAADAWAAFRDALRDLRLPLREEDVRHGDYSLESGIELCGELLDAPDPPTAIVCGNDYVAAGAVMGLLEQAGIRATVREDSAEHLFGVASLEMGRFGGVCVLEPDAGRAAELIEEYLRAVGAPESTEERGAAQ